jgi:hypothetical protein
VLDAPQSSGQFVISSVSGTGLEDMKEFLWRFVEVARREAAEAEANALAVDEPDDDGAAEPD